MGYYYPILLNSRRDLIHHLTQPWMGKSGRKDVIRHCCRGNILWSIVRITHHETGVREDFITCNLMVVTGGEWGYKPMDESCHPYYYTCPLGYLAATPPENEGWRVEVRAYHAKMQRRRDALRQVMQDFKG